MVDVRTIELSDLPAWIETMHVAYFIDRPVEEEVAYRAARVDYGRTLGAFDGESVVATFRSFATELTVPGGAAVSADAVTNVAVLPTHRRRGILSRMMAQSLAAAADRGDAASILFASEGPIYGRYGFGVATEQVAVRIARPNLRFRVPSDGVVALVPMTELRAVAPVVYERFRHDQPGTIARDDRFWDAMLGIGATPFGPKKGDRAVVFRDETGEPQGWLRYRGDETWTDGRPAGKLTVHQLIAATPAAYARLWRYATEVDLMTEIVAEQRPIAEPLPWLLTDPRAVSQHGRADGLWLRLLDPAAALRARTYTLAGELSLEVIDDAGFAAGRYRLEADPSGTACERTNRDPELALSVEALGAAYLGGVSLGLLGRAGLVEERVPGSLARADAMFASPIVPWSPIEF